MPNEDGTPTPEETQKQEADAKVKAEADAKAKAEDEKNKALDSESKKKELHLQNINKAIDEAEEDLRKKREAAKVPIVADPAKPEDPVPQIDENAPEVKAWDKRIGSKVDPLTAQNEAEKAEIRKFALSKFLADKPALASNPEKLKELMDVYGRIATNTGKTQEGVLIDLNKAFGAVYNEQLINAAKSGRIERAKELELFSDPAVDKGATGYSDTKVKRPNLTAEDRKQLAQWGWTEEQYFKSLENKEKASASE